MKPLFVLLLSFVISSGACWFIEGEKDLVLSGNIAMCIMLLFTALGHFKFTNGMVLMLPGFIPYKKPIVYVTGILEIVLGIALLFSEYRYWAGIVIIIMFILMLPANISAAMRHVNYEKADDTGKGLEYLWFRVPFQIFLIMWVVWYSVWNT